jgi:hypothetical protein
MEPAGSLLWSQKHATGHYPQPVESSSPLFPLLRSCQRISPGPRRFETFRNEKIFFKVRGC